MGMPRCRTTGTERKGRGRQSSTSAGRARPGGLALGRARCILLADPHGTLTQSIHGGHPLPASTILLLDSDADAGEAIASILTRAGYTVTRTADPDEAFAKATDQQLIVIDVASGPRSAVDICREIRATPALSAIPVMCVSATQDVEERIHFLEAGADDVMARPFDAREMEARVEALLLRFQRSRDLAPVDLRGRADPHARPSDGGRLQPEGRCRHDHGRDEHRHRRRRASPRQGHPGGLRPPVRWRGRPPQPRPEADHRRCRPGRASRASRTSSGRTRCATTAGCTCWPPRPLPRPPRRSRSAHVTQILTTLLESYDLVVIDAGSTLDERVLTIFEKAESVLLPITPEIGALKSMHALLEYMGEAGTIATKSTFVLNNLFAREILKLRDVESFLGAKMAVELPYDPFLYLKAVNEGVPIVTGAAHSIAAERLVKLSAHRVRRWSVPGPGRRRDQEVRRPVPASSLRRLHPGRLVPEPRFELGRPFGQRILSSPRLPIPPLRRRRTAYPRLGRRSRIGSPPYDGRVAPGGTVAREGGEIDVSGSPADLRGLREADRAR